jgi:hypothetical protein
VVVGTAGTARVKVLAYREEVRERAASPDAAQGASKAPTRGSACRRSVSSGPAHDLERLCPDVTFLLDLDQIWSLVDDLIEAHGDWLPPFDAPNRAPTARGSRHA